MQGGKKFHSLVVWTLQEKSLFRSQKLVDMEQGRAITFPRANIHRKYHDQGPWLSERHVQHKVCP